jgi:hypothetical protein
MASAPGWMCTGQTPMPSSYLTSRPLGSESVGEIVNRQGWQRVAKVPVPFRVATALRVPTVNFYGSAAGTAGPFCTEIELRTAPPTITSSPANRQLVALRAGTSHLCPNHRSGQMQSSLRDRTPNHSRYCESNPSCVPPKSTYKGISHRQRSTTMHTATYIRVAAAMLRAWTTVIRGRSGMMCSAVSIQK